MKKIFLLLCSITPFLILAQNDSPRQLDASERSMVIDSIGEIMERTYVFPKVGLEIKALLAKKLNEGAYNDITNPVAFSEALTNDIRSVNGDLHMRVRFDPQMVQNIRDMEMNEEDSLRLVKRSAKMGSKTQLWLSGSKDIGRKHRLSKTERIQPCKRRSR